MTRRKLRPEENERRAKIRELPQPANIGSMDDTQSLFKEPIAEFMENGLDAELDGELGYSKYDYKDKDTDNSGTGTAAKGCAPASAMWRYPCPGIVRANLSLRC